MNCHDFQVSSKIKIKGQFHRIDHALIFTLAVTPRIVISGDIYKLPQSFDCVSHQVHGGMVQTHRLCSGGYRSCASLPSSQALDLSKSRNVARKRGRAREREGEPRVLLKRRESDLDLIVPEF